jgi:hypothetical protein
LQFFLSMTLSKHSLEPFTLFKRQSFTKISKDSSKYLHSFYLIRTLTMRLLEMLRFPTNDPEDNIFKNFFRVFDWRHWSLFNDYQTLFVVFDRESLKLKILSEMSKFSINNIDIFPGLHKQTKANSLDSVRSLIKDGNCDLRAKNRTGWSITAKRFPTQIKIKLNQITTSK